ncbi:hypothetical protein PR048_014657 [Dryococelus australis]|uniref:Uncharacterized protein n=1 Tax=Dryococelus australis TaxID=614101 RepID=A0ABQ9HEV9_9NEOP|nr:hypothetical protein PR048_014657 [Dryococelus australis]
MKFISNRRNWWFEISIRDQQPPSTNDRSISDRGRCWYDRALVIRGSLRSGALTLFQVIAEVFDVIEVAALGRQTHFRTDILFTSSSRTYPDTAVMRVFSRCTPTSCSPLSRRCDAPSKPHRFLGLAWKRRGLLYVPRVRRSTVVSSSALRTMASTFPGAGNGVKISIFPGLDTAQWNIKEQETWRLNHVNQSVHSFVLAEIGLKQLVVVHVAFEKVALRYMVKSWLAISRPPDGCEMVHRWAIAVISIWAMLGPFVFTASGPVMGRVRLVMRCHFRTNNGAGCMPAVGQLFAGLASDCKPSMDYMGFATWVSSSRGKTICKTPAAKECHYDASREDDTTRAYGNKTSSRQFRHEAECKPGQHITPGKAVSAASQREEKMLPWVQRHLMHDRRFRNDDQPTATTQEKMSVYPKMIDDLLVPQLRDVEILYTVWFQHHEAPAYLALALQKRPNAVLRNLSDPIPQPSGPNGMPWQISAQAVAFSSAEHQTGVEFGNGERDPRVCSRTLFSRANPSAHSPLDVSIAVVEAPCECCDASGIATTYCEKAIKRYPLHQPVIGDNYAKQRADICQSHAGHVVFSHQASNERRSQKWVCPIADSLLPKQPPEPLLSTTWSNRVPVRGHRVGLFRSEPTVCRAFRLGNLKLSSVFEAEKRGIVKCGSATRIKCAIATNTKALNWLAAFSSLCRYDGYTARLARRSDEALGVPVKVARIAASLLDRGRGVEGPLWLTVLACSPPTKANGFIPRPGHSRIFASGNCGGRCRWSADFLGDLSFPLPFYSGAAPYSPRFTLIGSQDLAVESHPNLFTRPLNKSECDMLCTVFLQDITTVQDILRKEFVRTKTFRIITTAAGIPLGTPIPSYSVDCGSARTLMPGKGRGEPTPVRHLRHMNPRIADMAP